MLRNLLFALATAATASAALAGTKCPPVPKAQWQPVQMLEKKLTDQGWTVRRVKVEDGCYEVYSVDGKGQRVETYFNPQTLEPAHR